MNTSQTSKSLKFAVTLVPLVLSGEKVSTWRLWDDKSLAEGDVIEMINAETKEQFATAKLTKVIEKPLGQLTEEDKAGHETFGSDEEMYATYSRYYDREVGPSTPVKIVWFALL